MEKFKRASKGRGEVVTTGGVEDILGALDIKANKKFVELAIKGKLSKRQREAFVKDLVRGGMTREQAEDLISKLGGGLTEEEAEELAKKRGIELHAEAMSERRKKLLQLARTKARIGSSAAIHGELSNQTVILTSIHQALVRDGILVKNLTKTTENKPSESPGAP